MEGSVHVFGKVLGELGLARTRGTVEEDVHGLLRRDESV